MAEEFSYDNTSDIDADALAEIVGEMSGGGLKPLSDEEKEQRQLEHWRFLDQCRERDRLRQLEYEQERFALAEAERLESEQRTAAARYERQQKLNDELRRQSDRQNRDRSLTRLLDHAIDQRRYREVFAKSAQQAASRRRLSSALDAAIALKNPPSTPEPQILDDDDAARWHRTWFK